MPIQFDKANRIEDNTESTDCPHSDIVKEYYLSSQTGDYRCRQCGATLTEQEVRIIKLNKKS